MPDAHGGTGEVPRHDAAHPRVFHMVERDRDPRVLLVARVRPVELAFEHQPLDADAIHDPARHDLRHLAAAVALLKGRRDRGVERDSFPPASTSTTVLIPHEVARAGQPVKTLIRESTRGAVHLKRGDPLRRARSPHHDAVARRQPFDALQRQRPSARGHRLVGHADGLRGRVHALAPDLDQRAAARARGDDWSCASRPPELPRRTTPLARMRS